MLTLQRFQTFGMKAKFIHFFAGFIIYGFLGYLIVFWFGEEGGISPLEFALIWGFFMSLADVFVLERIRNRKKKEK
jgi:hypothetical protein